MKNLALEDGIVDDAEKIVLKRILDAIPEGHFPDDVWKDLQKFRKDFGI